MNESRLLEIYDEMKDALSVSVKIDNSQVLKIILRDLRNKRKHLLESKQIKAMEHFDYVLRYYFGDEDFEKYVTEWQDID